MSLEQSPAPAENPAPDQPIEIKPGMVLIHNSIGFDIPFLVVEIEANTKRRVSLADCGNSKEPILDYYSYLERELTGRGGGEWRIATDDERSAAIAVRKVLLTQRTHSIRDEITLIDAQLNTIAETPKPPAISVGMRVKVDGEKETQLRGGGVHGIDCDLDYIVTDTDGDRAVIVDSVSAESIIADTPEAVKQLKEMGVCLVVSCKALTAVNEPGGGGGEYPETPAKVKKPTPAQMMALHELAQPDAKIRYNSIEFNGRYSRVVNRGTIRAILNTDWVKEIKTPIPGTEPISYNSYFVLSPAGEALVLADMKKGGGYAPDTIEEYRASVLKREAEAKARAAAYAVSTEIEIKPGYAPSGWNAPDPDRKLESYDLRMGILEGIVINVSEYWRDDVIDVRVRVNTYGRGLVMEPADLAHFKRLIEAAEKLADELWRGVPPTIETPASEPGGGGGEYPEIDPARDTLEAQLSELMALTEDCPEFNCQPVHGDPRFLEVTVNNARDLNKEGLGKVGAVIAQVSKLVEIMRNMPGGGGGWDGDSFTPNYELGIDAILDEQAKADEEKYGTDSPADFLMSDLNPEPTLGRQPLSLPISYDRFAPSAPGGGGGGVPDSDEPEQPIFFKYIDGGFTSVDWLSLPYSDDEPIWDNRAATNEDWVFAVGAKPSGFSRQWATVGSARQAQREAQLPPMSFSDFVRGMATDAGMSALDYMDRDFPGGGGGGGYSDMIPQVYGCQICGESFVLSSSLEQHILENHPPAMPGSQARTTHCVVCERAIPFFMHLRCCDECRPGYIGSAAYLYKCAEIFRGSAPTLHPDPMLPLPKPMGTASTYISAGDAADHNIRWQKSGIRLGINQYEIMCAFRYGVGVVLLCGKQFPVCYIVVDPASRLNAAAPVKYGNDTHRGANPADFPVVYEARFNSLITSAIGKINLKANDDVVPLELKAVFYNDKNQEIGSLRVYWAEGGRRIKLYGTSAGFVDSRDFSLKELRPSIQAHARMQDRIIALTNAGAGW